MLRFNRCLFRIAVVCLAPAFLIQAARAATKELERSAKQASPTREGSAEAVAEADPPEQVPAGQPQGQRWRYRFYHGRWWYWLPSERWVIWNGEKWIDHQPFVAVPQSSATWNNRKTGTGLDWSKWSTLDTSSFDKIDASLGSDSSGYAWTRSPLGSSYSPLVHARAMPDSDDAVLERSRWSLGVSANERSLEQSFWPRSYYFNNQGYYSPGYSSPLYRHSYLPAPVGQFNYSTSAGGYMGGALTNGMANGFLNRWP